MVDIMEEKELFELLCNSKNQIQKVIDCNQYTKKFSVSLSKKDVRALLEARKESLKEQERVEFGDSILPKIIFAFCDSPYVYQDNYKDTLESLQDIFYLYKNESMDEPTDDELIDYMKKEFNGVCQGSLEYLEYTSLEKFARDIRSGTINFIGGYKEKEEDKTDEEEL